MKYSLPLFYTFMKYIGTVKFWITNFGKPDFSFGIHVCLKGRVDIHFMYWMISIGNVPIYSDKTGKHFAVSNSYHSDKKKPIRAGVP